MKDGYNSSCNDPSKALDSFDIDFLQLESDINDVLKATVPSYRPDWLNMTLEEFRAEMGYGYSIGCRCS